MQNLKKITDKKLLQNITGETNILWPGASQHMRVASLVKIMWQPYNSYFLSSNIPTNEGGWPKHNYGAALLLILHGQ